MKSKKDKTTRFQDLVYAATRNIPKGKVSTYGNIARKIGNPRSARSVGNALNRNPFAPKVPCHRVVRNGGLVGGFAGGQEKKIKILKKEGLKIIDRKLVEFRKIVV
jgi:methylated-DNA-[protein]-cysteine S-methyltransferase